MKKLFTLLYIGGLLLGSISLSSCEGTGVPISLPQEIDQTFVVPANNDSGFVITKDVSGNIDSILLANNVNRDQIDFIILTGAKFGQIDSAGGIAPSIFEFDTIRVLIGNVDQPTFKDSVLAYIPDIVSAAFDEGGFTVMELQSTDIDLVPYITKPKYRITITGKSKYPITKDLYYRLKVKMNIGVLAI